VFLLNTDKEGWNQVRSEALLIQTGWRRSVIKGIPTSTFTRTVQQTQNSSSARTEEPNASLATHVPEIQIPKEDWETH